MPRPAWIRRLGAAFRCVVFIALTILPLSVVLLLAGIREPQNRYISPGLGILSEGALLVSVLISTAIMALIERRSVWSYGLSDLRAFQRFLYGVFWGIVLPSILVGGLAATGHLVTKPALFRFWDILTYGCGWATAFFIVGMAEETLFRGYLQITLVRLIGFWPAALFLSIVFGLAHLSNLETSPLSIIAAGLLGLILSLCLQLSGSLWWGIGLHTAWNWTQSFLYGTSSNGYYVEGHLLQSQPIGDPRWSGGQAGPEASALILPILALTIVIVRLSFRGRRLPAPRET
jgi:membrane protease YdiL (CAAX protease family)